MTTFLQHTSEGATKAKTQTVHILYDRYAAMLLGYITEIVHDRAQAEQYLADVFTAVALQSDEFLLGVENDYCKLQMLTRKRLSSYFDSIKDCNVKVTVQNRSNKYLDQMSTLQQHVFCSVHYYGKTTCQLAGELNETEDHIRKLLKDAFAILRKKNQDAGLH